VSSDGTSASIGTAGAGGGRAVGAVPGKSRE
jgi:hypothetical protein